MKSNVRFTWNQMAISRMKQRTCQGMYNMAEAIRIQAYGRAPKDTGALRGSIKVRPPMAATKIEVIAGGTTKEGHGRAVRYARIHELGGFTGRGHSVYIPARHYLKSAFDNVVRGSIKKYFKDITK